MKTEPLTKAARKAYLKSCTARIDKLLEEQTRWQRKRTIAENKLGWVRRRIDDLAKELCHEKVKSAT